MADRAFPLNGILAATATVALLGLSFGTLGAVIWRAEGWSGLDPADWAAVRFTLLQAGLSAGISVLLAVPVARALARRRFPGRRILITLLGAPFILPVIVAVLGLLAVFGRSGVLSVALGWVGLPPVAIFGLHGVVLAHVFFNMPLAVRLILQGWLEIPSERFRLVAALGARPAAVARLLEWPMLRQVVPAAFMVIFLISMTSFAVALTLGGGPKATTVELAIYQAFRFDFDLAKAALLAVVQFGMAGAAAAIAFQVSVPMAMGAGLDRQVERWDNQTSRYVAQDGLILCLATVFLALPLLMVLIDGLGRVTLLPWSVYEAAGRSLAVALASTALCLAFAFPMAVAIARMRRRARMVEGVGYLTIAASPLVIGTGLFILIFPIADPVALALPITALVNAAMSLPFALRVLVPAVRQVEKSFGPLADSLAMVGVARLKLFWWPRLRRPLGFAAGLAAALSMGDLGVIALFADPEAATLPLSLYRLMAAYRMEDAAGAGLLLLALSLGLFWAFDRGGRVNADA
jgi:thiamine transport system permease protein